MRLLYVILFGSILVKVKARPSRQYIPGYPQAYHKENLVPIQYFMLQPSENINLPYALDFRSGSELESYSPNHRVKTFPIVASDSTGQTNEAPSFIGLLTYALSLGTSLVSRPVVIRDPGLSFAASLPTITNGILNYLNGNTNLNNPNNDNLNNNNLNNFQSSTLSDPFGTNTITTTAQQQSSFTPVSSFQNLPNNNPNANNLNTLNNQQQPQLQNNSPMLYNANQQLNPNEIYVPYGAGNQEINALQQQQLQTLPVRAPVQVIPGQSTPLYSATSRLPMIRTYPSSMPDSRDLDQYIADKYTVSIIIEDDGEDNSVSPALYQLSSELIELSLEGLSQVELSTSESSKFGMSEEIDSKLEEEDKDKDSAKTSK